MSTELANRVRWVAPMQDPPSPARVANVLREAGVEPADELAYAAMRAWTEASVWTRRDAIEVVRLQRETSSIPRIVAVPSLDQDVHDLQALRQISAMLTPVE